MTWVLGLLAAFMAYGLKRRAPRVGVQLQAVVLIMLVVGYEAVHLKLL
ncbi:MAG TPA: hypothetical protein VKL22_07670 [Actinomycetota bacterium]|nr:hypothetical protein [Actinomycetota bacterium]HYX25097.1 hypothetical protein [Thermoanaerobaculia bacterium]